MELVAESTGPWLKSDQNGIEITKRDIFISYHYKLKSDQNGIEISVETILHFILSFVKIRPKWD